MLLQSAAEQGCLKLTLTGLWGSTSRVKGSALKKTFEIHEYMSFFCFCSGPKRYSWTGERWVYTHDGISLHQLLSKEFSIIFNKNMDLFDLAYS